MFSLLSSVFLCNLVLCICSYGILVSVHWNVSPTIVVMLKSGTRVLSFGFLFVEIRYAILPMKHLHSSLQVMYLFGSNTFPLIVAPFISINQISLSKDKVSAVKHRIITKLCL